MGVSSGGLNRRVLSACLDQLRAVVGACAGGIPDIVEDGVNGLLVAYGDDAALADAIERVATDGELARRLCEGAQASAGKWVSTPEEYADRVRAVVDAVLGR